MPCVYSRPFLLGNNVTKSATWTQARPRIHASNVFTSERSKRCRENKIHTTSEIFIAKRFGLEQRHRFVLTHPGRPANRCAFSKPAVRPHASAAATLYLDPGATLGQVERELVGLGGSDGKIRLFLAPVSPKIHLEPKTSNRACAVLRTERVRCL